MKEFLGFKKQLHETEWGKHGDLVSLSEKILDFSFDVISYSKC